jgi:hypothetical protein
MFDGYTRRARLMPALLSAVPAIAVTGAGAFSPEPALRISGLLLGGVSLAVCGLVRSAGRKLQPSLWEAWGGNPTVQRLRWRGPSHRDNVERLHRELGAVLDEPLPTEAEEAADPARADLRYEDASTILRNRTRDTSRFRLVFEENMEYGFRRNCLGLRPVAIAVAAVSLIVSVAFLFAGDPGDRWSRWGVSAVIAGAALIFWCRVVTPAWAREAAEVYADRLLEAVDTLRHQNSSS